MGAWARRHPVATFFVLAFGLTWLVWVPRAATNQGVLAADWAVAAGPLWTYGPALAAFLAATFAGGRPAVRDLGARLVRWRVGWQWYAVVLAGPAAFSLAMTSIWVALGGAWAMAGPPALTSGVDGGPLAVPTLLLLLVALALTDGLGEETGWRGYALPRLLEGHPALPSSLGLGLVWALWHLPLVWTTGAALEGRPVAFLLLQLPALSLLYTWVFRHTRESLLLAVLFHAAGNLWGVAVLPAAGDDAMPALLRTGATWLLALGVTAASARRRSG